MHEFKCYYKVKINRMDDKKWEIKELKRSNTDKIRYSDWSTNANLAQITQRSKTPKISTPKLPKINIPSKKRPSYNLKITLVPPISPFKHTYQTLQIDIFSLLAQTFRKKRFNFCDGLSHSQFQQICKHIRNVKDKPNTIFNRVEIVSIRSSQDFLNKVMQYSLQSDEYVGIIRHYLIAPQKIGQYQIRRLEDKLRRKQFNVSYNFTKMAHIYRVEDGSQIKNIYDLLEKGTYVIGEDQRAVGMYRQRENIKNEQNKYHRYLLKIGQITNLQDQVTNFPRSKKRADKIPSIEGQKFNNYYNFCLKKHKNSNRDTTKPKRKHILSHQMFLNLPVSDNTFHSYFQP